MAAGSKMTGHVHGGQQPVSGAKVYLYAVSTTQDAGSAESLLKAPGYVTTGSDGSFNIDTDYTCPTDADVYFLALGGNPGLPTDPDNTKIALVAGAGACSALSSSSYFTINEVTTVAMAYSFSGYATSGAQVGSSSSATIAAAFSNILNLVDPTEGTARTYSPGGDATVPQQKINSLANSLAACVNTDGNDTGCSKLFTYATRNGTVPGDTFQAALNIALAPTNEVSNIYTLASSDAAFMPALTAPPTDWTIAAQPLTFYPNMPPQPALIAPTASPSAPDVSVHPETSGNSSACAGTCPFFNGMQSLGSGVEYLQFQGGNIFGYFSFLTDPSYIYHFDLGYEYVFDAADGADGVFLYDFASNDFFYTNPANFPYLYDYGLNSTVYYYPDPSNPGHYNVNGIRYFWVFATGTIISK